MKTNNCVKVLNKAELPEKNRLAWQQASEQVEIPDGENPYQILLAKTTNFAEEYLPDIFKQQFEQMKQPDGAPFLVLQNIPIDRNLPPAPTDGKRPKQKTWVSEMVLLAMASAGNLQPLSYREEKGDTLVHEVAPIAGKELLFSNGGRVPLGFHTDAAILKRYYRPDYLMLLDLINQSQTPTYIALLDDALKALKELELGFHYECILQESRFRVESPESFNYWGGKVIKSEPRPLIIKGTHGKNEIAGNLYAVKTSDEEAASALKAFISILPQVAKPIVLHPGDLLIFDNHRCLHARAAIQGERWLQRIYCRHSLEQLRRATGVGNDCYVFETRSLVLE